jgi:hypothetical protein
MCNYELDHQFSKDICRLARKIGPKITKPATVDKVLDYVRDADSGDNDYQTKIKRLSRDYRIGKNEDISNDYPVKQVAAKIVECIEEGTMITHENVAAELFEFYPGNPTMNDYIQEHIKSRL